MWRSEVLERFILKELENLSHLKLLPAPLRKMIVFIFGLDGKPLSLEFLVITIFSYNWPIMRCR